MIFFTYTPKTEESIAPAIDHEYIAERSSQTAIQSEKKAKINKTESIDLKLGHSNHPSLNMDEALFTNRMELKVLLSKVSMHLSASSRDDIHQQIDELLDLEAFSEDDSLIMPESFYTFVRFCAALPHMKKVSLTVSPSGILGGTWINKDGRLHIDFLNDNKFRSTVTKIYPKENTYFAHVGSYKRTLEFIYNNNFQSWFTNG